MTDPMVFQEVLGNYFERSADITDSNRRGAKTNSKALYSYLKRMADVVISLAALTVLFIPMLILAIVICIDMPGASPIFKQKRVGKGGREFTLYKLRTMVPNAENMLDEVMAQNEMDGPVFKIKNDPRTTAFSRVIRKYGWDELPQLINVLKNDMSIVGPRPALPREVEKYTAYERRRLEVLPGLTCLWQIQPQRNEVSFSEWMALDMKYIRERSVKTDIGIMLRTARVVLSRAGW